MKPDSRIKLFVGFCYLLLCLGALSLGGCKSMSGVLGTRSATLDLPPSRSDEMETASVDLHASELLGDPLYVMLGIDVVHRDQLDIRQPLMEGIYATLSQSWVKVRASDARSGTPFREEIERSLRQSSGASYLGEQKVNYILSGRLEISSFRERYSPPSFLCTTMRDNCKGTCEYEAQATLSLEAESLPEKRRSKKWILKTSESRSFDADRACPRNTSPGDGREHFNDMIDDVLADLLSCSEQPLQDYFASRAYVLNYFSDGTRFLFEISGGEAAGFRPGDSVVVESFTDASDTDALPIGSGKVVSVSEKRGYITVPSQVIANQIRKHDRVRVQKTRYIPRLQCKFLLEG